ncbi:MAG: tripartite tricarboxylate transporter TctB family protein [Pseudomonadota bacterium]
MTARSSSDFRDRCLGWITLLGGVAGLVYVATAQRFDAYPEELTFVFPGALFLALIPVGALLAFRRQAGGAEASADTLNADAAPNASGFVKVAAFTWGYAVLIALIGFPPATFLFQAAVIGLVFNHRKALWLVGAPLALTIAFTLFFDGALSVPLPRGVGVFYSFNALFI